MDAAQAPATFLSVHVGVLILSLPAYYRFGDRTELYSKSLEGVASTLARLSGLIGDELSTALKPVFQDRTADPSLVVSDDIVSYTERPVDPTHGDVFRETVRRFVQSTVGRMLDYRQVLQARRRWCLWSRFLSRTLLCIVAYQLTISAVLALLHFAFEIEIATSWFITSFAPTAALCALALVSLFVMQGSHDEVQFIREGLDEL